MGKYLLLLAALWGCDAPKGDLNQEIVEVEKAFETMALDSGVAIAFKFFAAPDGHIIRQNQAIEGKDAIYTYLANQENKDASLHWSPIRIVVSESGDLAYSSGDYLYTLPDSTGAIQEYKGVFATVWQRQPDGQWRFIHD